MVNFSEQDLDRTISENLCNSLALDYNISLQTLGAANTFIQGYRDIFPRESGYSYFCQLISKIQARIPLTSSFNSIFLAPQAQAQTSP